MEYLKQTNKYQISEKDKYHRESDPEPISLKHTDKYKSIFLDY